MIPALSLYCLSLCKGMMFTNHYYHINHPLYPLAPAQKPSCQPKQDLLHTKFLSCHLVTKVRRIHAIVRDPGWLVLLTLSLQSMAYQKYCGCTQTPLLNTTPSTLSTVVVLPCTKAVMSLNVSETKRNGTNQWHTGQWRSVCVVVQCRRADGWLADATVVGQQNRAEW